MSQDWSIPNAAPVTIRPLRDPCRCGWPDDHPVGVEPVRVPIVDLRNEPGVIHLESSPTRRTCRACTHPILPDRASVVHRLTDAGGVYNRYHPECVDAGRNIA